MLEIFAPYLTFISFFITIVINVYLIIKVKVNWVMLLIANLLLTLIMNFVGLGEYDLITQIINFIVELVVSIFGGLKDVVGGWLRNIFKLW